ncbi:GNAT family N-acetyltransferase [Streptomyces sp. ISL-11]|uniref:GNAT family N-acetyltransferase n=1 Tax=Streptomyces sp. ISL-11 TaxID=2819174 RepID=UPI001BE5BFFD|nr:GNAT family N-acetyltransferase [Streptomyces sp. ISL-11]MBT2386378.1 GNAT family N-acetyltransferase [Streptomyces sp. ISL-11]
MTDTRDGRAVCRVRRREDSDLGACVRALAAVHERDGYPVDWPARPDVWLSPPSSLTAWVAELDGRSVGHIGLCRAGAGDVAPGLWSDREGVGRGTTAVISRLFVAPDGRGRGIGASLMAEAVREARCRGLHPVLDVVATDTAAAALYERLGWELLGTAEQRWGPGRTVTLRCYAAAFAGPGDPTESG